MATIFMEYSYKSIHTSHKWHHYDVRKCIISINLQPNIGLKSLKVIWIRILHIIIAINERFYLF
jgi:hypothetical protein